MRYVITMAALAALPVIATSAAFFQPAPPPPLRTSPADAPPARAGAPVSVTADGHGLGSVATLDDALRLVRDYRRDHAKAAIVVALAAGTYRVTGPILIGAQESGPGGSLVIRGDPAGGTTIKGSIVPGYRAGSTPGIDPGTVPGIATPALQYQSYVQQTGDAEPLVFSGGQRIGLSRWPQRGYLTGWKVATRPEGTLVSHSGLTEPVGTSVLVVGYLTSDWAYEAIPGRVTQSGILLSGYRPASPPQFRPRLAVANVAGKDASRGIRIEDGGRIALPDGIRSGSQEIAVARELLVVERATNVAIENIAFEHSVGNAVRIYVSSHVSLRNCYAGGTGGAGISIDGGDHVTVDRCVVSDTGRSGITLFGGDRATLAGSGHVVRDSVIQRAGWRIRAYAPGVALLGVGNRLLRSTIKALPHAAVGISGNDNAVEGSDIHAVACETGDVGAIYMGRDWTQRGNRVFGNFLHDIGTADPSLGNTAVYLDDQFSGVAIARNVILRASQGVVIGGGRDNSVTDNVFARMALSAVWMDQRGLGVQKADTAPGGALRRQLDASPFLSPIWRARYPDLLTLPDDRPGAAVGNLAARNVVVGSVFLQTDPPGLFLAGENRRAPDQVAQGLATMPVARQYAVLRALLSRSPASAAVPGAAARLLYADRIVDTPACGTVNL